MDTSSGSTQSKFSARHELLTGTELKLHGPATFSYLTLPPYDLTQYESHDSSLQHSFTQDTIVVLEKSLTRHPLSCQFKSPVWTARINDRIFVVKIFQACFHRPNWSDDIGCHDFWPEEEQAHREAFAYSALTNLQGNGIPRSYGFYKASK